MRRAVELCLVLGAVLVGGAQSLSGQAKVVVDSNVAIPMRDGVVLRADVWRPAGSGPFPVLVYRTPYDRAEAAEASGVTRQAVERGYAVVLQDVRGRYGSEGAFEPYRHESRDGYDTIEWAARQPWSNGAVGTAGLSYPGAVQWLAAVEHPPALRAMVPAMTYARPEQFWYSGGVWDGSWLDWTWFNIAPDLRQRLGVAGPMSYREARDAWRAEGDSARRWRPLVTLPHFQGVAPWYYEWMRHPPRDPWWGWAELDRGYAGLATAVLNISGWFDEPYGPVGAVTNYLRLTEARGGPLGTRLVLGPWTHGVDAIMSDSAGDRVFPGAGLDYAELVLDWMDRHLKGRGETDSLPVHVYVMGANRWRRFPAWPVPGLRPDTLRLAGPAGPARIGRLSRTPGRPSASSMRSDPTRPLTDPYAGAYGPHDYRALAPGTGLLAFETGPFTAPVELIGAVTAELHVEARGIRDFDLWVQLYDVDPDSTAWNLASPGTGLLRASYRSGGPAREPVKDGEVLRLRIGGIHTANRFLPGHRLRVVLSGAFYPLFSVNPQTGRSELESTGTRPGTIVLRHSAEHPSWLILPVVPVSDE